MTRRSKVWPIVALVFTLINLVGAVYAAALGEGPHAGIHVGLTLLGAYFVWRLEPRAPQSDESVEPLGDARLELLQQSVDAVAIEVERIGEAQRFTSKLAAERAEASALKRS